MNSLVIAQNITKRNLEKYKPQDHDILPILFQAGYLTIKDFDEDKILYTLVFPNEEVEYSFLYILMEVYSEKVGDIGVTFSDKTRTIKDWTVEEIH